MASVQDNNSLLLYRVGPVLCCAPSLMVETIIQPPTLTRTPGSSSAKPGIFKHAGHIVSSFDLRYKFGVEQKNWIQPGRMILTQLEKGNVGFWVDEILAVIEFPPKGWGALPAGIPRGIFSKTLLLDNKIYLYAEFEKLFTIQDTGYLKQYIQQILQKENTRKTLTDSGEVSTGKMQSKTSPRDLPTTNNTVPETETGSADTSSTSTASTIPANKNTIPSTPVTVKHTADANKKLNTNNTVTQNSDTQKSLSSSVHPATPASSSDIPVPEIKPGAMENKTTREKTSVGINTQKSTHSIVTENTNTKPVVKPARTSLQIKEETRQISSAVPDTDEKSSGAWLAVVFLLLLFSGLGSGIWYILKPRSAILTVSTDYTETHTETNNYEYQSYSATVKPAQTEPASTESNVHKEPVTAQPSGAVATTPTESEKQSTTNISENKTGTTTADGGNAYRASIKQDQDGVTIILDSPADDPVFRQEDKPDVTPVNSDKETTETSTPQKAVTAAVEVQPVRTQIEIIHIVVKGDTLWHIARRYVNNPYRYPELARLSNIKNPDRIYPGNRVRIIKRQHQARKQNESK